MTTIAIIGASLGDATYAAPSILREMVSAGHLGKKTGRGFYLWPGEALK